MKKYKVNLHLTEACNFKCRYCFAHFEKHSILKVKDWKQIILNCSQSGMVEAINFAGGEPLLFPSLMELVQYARQLGLHCSLISNASLMTDAWICENAGYFETIGISVDSFADGIMQQIGRCNANGEALTLNMLSHRLHLIHTLYPDVRLKLNTVVNRLNMNENMAAAFIRCHFPVARWKLLKMCPFDDGCHNNAALAVSDDEYFRFVHHQLSQFGITDFGTDDVAVFRTFTGMDIVSERELRGGYIIVDAGGYLVDDTLNSSYTRVIQCQETPLAEGIAKLTFIHELYQARYAGKAEVYSVSA